MVADDQTGGGGWLGCGQEEEKGRKAWAVGGTVTAAIHSKITLPKV
jgi:hypothetical protein